MNKPDPSELFELPEGTVKVQETADTRLPDASTFVIEREDHTLGNLLRAQILKDNRVIFTGYRVPHPLIHNFELKIQTKPGHIPRDVLTDSVRTLKMNVQHVQQQLRAHMTS